MANTILLVEDEQPIREMLRIALARAGYQVEEVEDANSARQFLARARPDLMIIDWMMPGESGVDFIASLRQQAIWNELPIIMLTARVEEMDKVKGLDCGADDYLTKPVAIKELIARIKAILRRINKSNSDNQLVSEGLTLDLNSFQLTIDGNPVAMGQTEFGLLKFFVQNKNKVYSRSQLLDFVWGHGVYIEERTVDVHILRLRKILSAYQKDSLIKTVRGVGYSFTSSTQE